MAGSTKALTRAMSFVLATALALTGAPAGAERPAPVVSKPSRLLTVTPPSTLPDEPVTIAGRSSQRKRQRIVLQQLRPDGTWRPVTMTRSSRDGRFTLVVPTATSATAYRALGAKGGRGRRWTSRPVTVAPASQSARLVAPVEARAGEPVVVTAFVEPARPGRAVQLLVDGVPVATGTQDAHGAVVTSFAAPGAGLHAVVAAVPAVGNAPATASPAQRLRTTTAVTGVPRIDITTVDGEDITSKTAYKRATLELDPRGSGVPAYSSSVRLRVRGNYTSLVTLKRPYKLKLDDDAALAGLPASEDWVLLANFFDRSLLRTTLGFEVSRRMGLAWSPRMVDAEVWLNGTFKGLYQLGEGIEVDPDRLDVQLAESSPAQGGFVLEADQYDDTDPRFTTTRGLQVYVKEPGDADQAYVDGVAAQVQAFEDALYGPSFADPTSGYRAHIDVASFVDWYLTMELTKNIDASLRNSVHLYRPIGGRLTLGPAWDFDISAGVRSRWSNSDPTGWFVRRNWYGDASGVPSQYKGQEGHWFVRLFQDPAFESAVRKRWEEVRASLFGLPGFLAARRALITDSAERNFAPAEEGGAAMPLGPTNLDPVGEMEHWPTYEAGADSLASWLCTRLGWMDAQLTGDVMPRC